MNSLDSRYRAEAAVEVERMRVRHDCIGDASLRLTGATGRNKIAQKSLQWTGSGVQGITERFEGQRRRLAGRA